MVYEYAKFLKVFLRAPALTSAIVPSSRWLAERMIEDLRLDQAKVVVELGAGTGAFTRAIQKELHPAATFLAVEINPVFAGHLKRRFPRVHVINDSAERLVEHLQSLGQASADCILSGLPWAGFKPEEQQRLLAAVLGALRPDGHLTTYAYNHVAWLPGGVRFRKLLRSSFSDVATTRTEWRNLPPAFVYRCRK
ncbi:MAG TPA: methyltransferase domain-containing protein [Verrucomicrobiae bacterium]|nr:methyltransferase domain-containing protein [Verrucomicrobiae bacterium]